MLLGRTNGVALNQVSRVADELQVFGVAGSRLADRQRHILLPPVDIARIKGNWCAFEHEVLETCICHVSIRVTDI